MKPDRPSWMSRATLAAELDVSESTVDEMVRRGVIPPPARLSNGCIRWRWETVDAALATMLPTASHAPVDAYSAGIRNATQKTAERGRRGAT